MTLNTGLTVRLEQSALEKLAVTTILTLDAVQAANSGPGSSWGMAPTAYCQ
jgi:hypothetical protein